MLTLVPPRLGHGIGNINKIGWAEFIALNLQAEMLNTKELDEGLLTLESFRLVNVDTVAKRLKLIAFVFVVKIGYSNQGRCPRWR